jgi:glycosyltransferase involved in cell wall biosynthesis
MHIAIVAPSHKSFIANFLPNINLGELPNGYFGAPFIGTIIKELLEKNHTVTAITTSTAINGDYSIKKYKCRNFTWIIVPSRPNSFRFNKNKLGRMVDFYSLEQKNIIQSLKNANPDFVHAHWSYEFAGSAVKSGFPYLVTVHDNAFQVLRYFKNIYRFGRLLMSEQILRKVKYASTVSPYMQDYTSKRCEFVKVIPNPTILNLQKEDIEKEVIAKMNTLQAPRIIMINNGWDTRKNGKVGLLAFQNLQKRIPDATLHIYGGGSEENGSAFKEASYLGIQNVFFNGAIAHQQLINVIKESHLLIHPALEESFGVVLIEAMSYGVPTIGGLKSGAVPWVIKEPQLLLDVTKPEQMANKMFEILTSSTLYKNLSLECYLNVASRFSSNAVVATYIDYYEEILLVNK